MRIAVGGACFSLVLALAAEAQEEPVLLLPEPGQVRKLTVIANDLPAALKKQISHALRGKTCQVDELQERVRQQLRDAGFAEARVDVPRFADGAEERDLVPCDVSVFVTPGAQYRIEMIRFLRNFRAIPEDQVRREFAIEGGEMFNATAISKGIEHVLALYRSKGYIDVGIFPELVVDEVGRTVTLTLDIDEGRARDFGRLFLDGPEPYAGAGKALLAAWTLEGRRYNPELLSKWIDSNAPFLRKRDGPLWRYAPSHFNMATQRVDIELRLPWPDGAVRGDP